MPSLDNVVRPGRGGVHVPHGWWEVSVEPGGYVVRQESVHMMHTVCMHRSVKKYNAVIVPYVGQRDEWPVPGSVTQHMFRSFQRHLLLIWDVALLS